MRKVGGFLVIIGLLSARVPDQVGATAYECLGQAGSSVFTDDPTGFQGCRLLSTTPASVSPGDPTPSGAAPSGTSTNASDDQPLMGLDVPADAAVSDRVPDRTGPRPGRSSAHDPEYSPASTVIAPSAQTCARGMNRLNPFGGGPCDAAGAYVPMRAPSEGASR